MKRNIFESYPITSIQQGCIFYGAIADGIPYPVHGVIITPRCDIDQNKVLHINYLPITSLKDWIRKDLTDTYRAKEIPKRKCELEGRLKKRGINISLDPSHKIESEALRAILSNPKDAGLIADIISYWNLFDDDQCQATIKTWNNYNSKISELCKGQMERYLLLEHWIDSEDQYFVIHLTQVKHLSLELSKRLLTGFDYRLINPETEDLFYSDVPADIKYQVVAQLKSPYIEYVCQKFSNAFFRIGIEDWPHQKMGNVIIDHINRTK